MGRVSLTSCLRGENSEDGLESMFVSSPLPIWLQMYHNNEMPKEGLHSVGDHLQNSSHVGGSFPMFIMTYAAASFK